MSNSTFNTLATITVVLIFYNIYRKLIISAIALRTKYKLFALRDEVRGIMIDHPNADHSFLDYMEYSICQMISELHHYNLRVAVFYYFKYRNDPSFKKNKEHVNKIMGINPVYKDISDRFATIVSLYTIEKDFSILLFLTAGMVTFKYLKKRGNIVIKAMAEIKNTSGYAPLIPEIAHAKHSCVEEMTQSAC